MSNHNLKSRYAPILKMILWFIVNTLILACIDFFRKGYDTSHQEMWGLLISSLIFGTRFSFFIFILLGMFKVFQQQKNN